MFWAVVQKSPFQEKPGGSRLAGMATTARAVEIGIEQVLAMKVFAVCINFVDFIDFNGSAEWGMPIRLHSTSSRGPEPLSCAGSFAAGKRTSICTCF